MQRVLIAEDDEANRMMLARVLEKRGFSVASASDGLDVLKALDDAREREEPFDVLLLDWMMPVLSGIEALPQIRKVEPTLPIVMLTARGGRDDILGAFELGADDYLTKPFDFDILLARLEARLRGVAHRQSMTIETRPLDDGTADVIVNGRYKLLEQIGSGAFGVVFRAQHLTLETEVAVKMLKPNLTPTPAHVGPIDSLGRHVSREDDGAEQFRLEGVRACRVKHDNAVRIFDFGVLSSGKAYLVMELLRGQTLDQELRAARRLPLQRAVEVLRPVLACLAAAHSQGVVHRDIKPANIFLHRGMAGEVVKVLDFGVAKLLESDGAVTRDMIPGSPSYMAPERLRGMQYDGKSDVYSVGITLYELLTGDVPFRTASGEILAIALRHLRDEATPPTTLVPGLPPMVDDVVRALLTKDPAQRPTAAEAASLLTKLLTAEPSIDIEIDVDDAADAVGERSLGHAPRPVAFADAASPSQAAVEPASADVALVVDDDPATRGLIARALRELKIDVAPFPDAESALANLDVVKPAFALLDVTLPGMSGVELGRIISSRGELRSTPLLLMSAAGGENGQAREAEAMGLGAFFLEKPFRLAMLNEAVRELRAERVRRTSERRRPRILIVDDDDGIRQALTNIVSEEGYDAVGAADAFEALSLCGAAAPRLDVAVIDVMLPGLDGPGLAAPIKATKHLGSVPIVMISAFDSLQAHATRIGARALKKPFDLEEFIELVRETVEDPVRMEAR